MKGDKNDKKSLISGQQLKGMTYKGKDIILVFILESNRMYIMSDQQNEEINMDDVRNIVNEPIVGHEEYHIMVSELLLLF